MSIGAQQEAEQLQPVESWPHVEDTLPVFNDFLGFHSVQRNGSPERSLLQHVNSVSHDEAGPSSSSGSPASSTDKMHYCHNCSPPKAFQKKHQLTTHQRRHNPRFACEQPQCYERFQYRKDLTRHMKTVHARHSQGTKCFPCPNGSCQWSLQRGSCGFKRNDSLLRHLRKVHKSSSLSPSGSAS